MGQRKFLDFQLMNKHDINDTTCERFLLSALEAAYQAAVAILDIYNSGADFAVESKSDDSPLTAADRKSHEIICSALADIPEQKVSTSALNVPSSIPILSEEGKDIPFAVRKEWKRFWLVDPLDGTKEFIKRNGEFTVNIALIEGNTPVLGVVCVPVRGEIYFGAENIGAYKLALKGYSQDTGDSGIKDNGRMLGAGSGVSEDFFRKSLKSNSLKDILDVSCGLPLEGRKDGGPTDYTVVASRSHANSETESYIESLKKKYGQIRTISAGSSLKFCLVAEGIADCYPRLGPTMEWDTAAAHAVVAYAGKKVIIFDSKEELIYNKENLLNPWFVVK